MNKKLLGIILIFISLIIGLIIIFLIFFYNPAVPETIEPETTPEPVVTEPIVETPEPPKPKPVPSNLPPAPAEELSEESSRQVAVNFVQRFGTYSNQADLSRLNDLKFFVSSRYFQDLSDIIKNANTDYTNYVGYTTRSITERNLVNEATRAVFMVTTKRTEMKPDESARDFTQDIKVDLIKTGSGWKVDAATWQ